MATSAIRLPIDHAVLSQPASSGVSELSFKEKAKETTIKVLKVATSILLTIGAYAALAGAMIGLFIASQNMTFAVEHADKFVLSLISAIGVAAIGSMANPFQLYNQIYKGLFVKDDALLHTASNPRYRQVGDFMDDSQIEMRVIRRRGADEVETSFRF
jgi:hypothetical protein